LQSISGFSLRLKQKDRGQRSEEQGTRDQGNKGTKDLRLWSWIIEGDLER
jgi:hypothetical protein